MHQRSELATAADPMSSDGQIGADAHALGVRTPDWTALLLRVLRLWASRSRAWTLDVRPCQKGGIVMQWDLGLQGVALLGVISLGCGVVAAVLVGQGWVSRVWA